MKSKLMHKSLKAIAAIMLTAVMCLAVGCKKDNGGNGTYNGHDYIDLGLPSGTMWATCNVGADNPENYGDYFAWAETQSKTPTARATTSTATVVTTNSPSTVANPISATTVSQIN